MYRRGFRRSRWVVGARGAFQTGREHAAGGRASATPAPPGDALRPNRHQPARMCSLPTPTVRRTAGSGFGRLAWPTRRRTTILLTALRQYEIVTDDHVDREAKTARAGEGGGHLKS